MTIEQYLADLLKPQAWKGDKPTKPVLAPKMGDGKLLAEVTPIGSCPESWYDLEGKELGLYAKDSYLKKVLFTLKKLGDEFKLLEQISMNIYIELIKANL